MAKLTYREYFLREAKRALKDNLPRTAKQHLKNAETLKDTPTFDEIWERKLAEGRARTGDNAPITNKPMGE